MKFTPAQRCAWQKLLAYAAEIRSLAPWKWMREDEVFGLSDPDSQQVGFVTTRQTADGQFEVDVLMGARALHDYRTLHQSAAGLDRTEVEENLQLVPRLEMTLHTPRPWEDWETELSRSLGTGDPESEPRFRSFRPGHLPWMLEEDEVHFMTRALEQLRAVSRRKMREPGLLSFNGSHQFLVREPQRRGAEITWHDRIRNFPPPKPSPIPIVWNQSDIDYLKRLPKQNHVLAADFFLFPGVFEEQGQRPVCTYVLMVVHAQSNLVLCAEPMSVVTSLERMWGAVPGVLASAMVNFEIRPCKIQVRSNPLLRLLRSLQAELDFELEQSSRLPGLETVKDTFQDFFQQHAHL